MLYIKPICLIVFIIINILFTVGYASQPLVNNTDESGSITVTNSFVLSTNNSSLSKIILSLCITITVLLAVAVVISYLGFNNISKILFMIITILMLVAFLIIQIKIVSASQNNSIDKVKRLNSSGGSGYYIILTSLILMCINMTFFFNIIHIF